MRLKKSLLFVLLPIPVTLLSGYFIEKQIFPYMLPFLEVKGKEMPRLPDIQSSEEVSNLGVIDVLALIDIREVEEKKTVVERPEEKEEKPPAYRLTFTFVGPKKNYAIVDGRLLKEGDFVSPEEKIVKITREGILLSGKWGRRWIYISK